MKKEFRNAELFGMLSAVQVALRAIVRAHPDPDALEAAFRSEHEETMASLLPRPLPDVSLDAYRDFLSAVAPNQSAWLEDQ